MMVIVPNSRTRKGGGEGEGEEFKERRRGMLTTGEWRNPVGNRGVDWGLGSKSLLITAALDQHYTVFC